MTINEQIQALNDLIQMFTTRQGILSEIKLHKLSCTEEITYSPGSNTMSLETIIGGDGGLSVCSVFWADLDPKRVIPDHYKLVNDHFRMELEKMKKT